MVALATTMLAQTFTIDPSVVKFAEQVNITSVDLYFRQKPYGVGNQSGTLDPGCSVFIVPTAAGGIPNIGKSLDDFIMSRKEFSEIVSSRDATVATKFTFTVPVAVKTGIEYAIIFKPDHDEVYELWKSTRGEISVSTNANSPGIAGKYIGRFFELSSANETWQPLNYKSLKFHVNVARYAYDGVIPQDFVPEFTLYTKNYEFVTYNKTTSVGQFMGGERVYLRKIDGTGNPMFDGTCSVTRGYNVATTTGGAFAGLFSPDGDDSYIAVQATSGGAIDVRKIVAVGNGDNSVTVDSPFSFTGQGVGFIRTVTAKAYVSRNGQFISGKDNFAVLSDSSANSTVNFSNNCLVVGEISGASLANCYFNDILVHSSEPHVYVYTPPQTTYKSNQLFHYTSNNNLNGVMSDGEMSFAVNMYNPINLDVNKPVMLMSRSNEVTLRNWSSKINSESSRIHYQIITTNDYSSPQVDYNASDVFFTRYSINNDYTNEHTNFGNAVSKHITTKVNFAQGRQAEDILVYMHAYKPPYTDFKVYVKFYNSEDPDYFDDKQWTLMREISAARPSSLTNLADYVEYTYALPNFVADPTYNIDTTTSGVIQVTPDTSTILGDGTDFLNELQPGDLIKIYPSIFPNKYFIASVYDIASATELTIYETFTSADSARMGSYGLKIDKIANKYQAFQNMANSNTLRYYNSKMTPFDKYDSFAIKVVFLSNNQFIIPKLANLRAVGVSA